MNNVFSKKWIVEKCNKKNCSCGIIASSDEDLIVSDGVLSFEIAEHIVNLHNDSIQNNFSSFQESNPLIFSKWKVISCFSGDSCWCKLIVTSDSAEVVIEYGGINKEDANYVVCLHNKYLSEGKIIKKGN